MFGYVAEQSHPRLLDTPIVSDIQCLDTLANIIWCETMVVCDTSVVQCQSDSLDNYFLAVWLHVFTVKWQEWQPMLNGSDQDYFQNTLLANTVYCCKAEHLPPIIRTQKHHSLGLFKIGQRTSRKNLNILIPKSWNPSGSEMGPHFIIYYKNQSSSSLYKASLFKTCWTYRGVMCNVLTDFHSN